MDPEKQKRDRQLEEVKAQMEGIKEKFTHQQE